MGSKLEELQKNKSDREVALRESVSYFIKSKKEKMFQYSEIIHNKIVNDSIGKVTESANELDGELKREFMNQYFDTHGSFVSGFETLQLAENLENGDKVPWKEILREIEKENPKTGNYYAPLFRYEVINRGSYDNYILYSTKDDALAYFELTRTELEKKPSNNKGILGYINKFIKKFIKNKKILSFLNKFIKEEFDIYGYYKVKTSQLFKDLIENFNKLSQKEGFRVSPLFDLEEAKETTGFAYKPVGLFIDNLAEGFSMNAKGEEHEFKILHTKGETQHNIPIKIYLQFIKNKRPSRIKEE